jgi:hypothetical protein
MAAIVTNLFHLLPEQQVEGSSPEQVYRCLAMTLCVQVAEVLMAEMDGNLDGRITQDEMVAAFLRQESFTTLLVNKVHMQCLYRCILLHVTGAPEGCWGSVQYPQGMNYYLMLVSHYCLAIN